MKRVMIIGGSGAGKSTLARKLGEITGLPVIHGDRFQFEGNWALVPDEERNAKLDQAAMEAAWIIDGNYSQTWPLRLSRADTVIFIDPPRYLRMWRIISRTFRYYGRNRPDMPEGCDERFDWAFLKWTWEFDKKRRSNTLRFLETARNDKTVITLQSTRKTKEWLAKLASRNKSLSP